MNVGNKKQIGKETNTASVSA